MTVAEYDKCVSQYSDNLYRFALKSLRSDDEAKDIVQESFLRLWENREAVLGGKEKSYLFTVAYRLIVDRVRMGKRYTGDESVLRTSPALGRPDYNGISELIDRFLDELPPLQKSLIMLRDYEGYSYREMAEMTRLSETQVKVYIFRARTALRRIIRGYKQHTVMRISIEDYESRALDYVEGNLPADELPAFEAFLSEHPDLGREIRSMRGSVPVLPAEKWVYPDKKALLRGGIGVSVWLNRAGSFLGGMAAACLLIGVFVLVDRHDSSRDDALLARGIPAGQPEVERRRGPCFRPWSRKSPR